MKRAMWMAGLALVAALVPVASAGARTSGDAFDLHVGDAFLAGLNPDFGAPNVARASNGDTFELDDLTGVFNKATKDASGTGTWTHKRDSAVLGSGTVTPVRTIAFQFYGCGRAPDGGALPPDFCGGRVIIAAHFVESTTGFEFDGKIEVNCQVSDPDDLPPPGTSEGVKINTRGINFNKHVSGFNLFVRS